MAPPGQLAPPITDPQIQVLNFHEITWPDFQKLVVSVARDIDGHREAYEYGRPGQAQHGLDVLGRNDRGEVHAYQARNVKDFTATDLRKAVADFAAGKRPWNPTRFIVVAGCGTNSTQLLDELARLRDAHSDDFEIGIYGEEKLTELLRDQPHIVERFFGPATAQRFCVGAIQPARSQPRSSNTRSTQIADAVLRGPIEAMGLASRLGNADRLRETDPTAAAAEYLSIAEKLSDGSWPGHALMMRRRAADSLARAGDERAAGRLLAQLFWTYLDLGADHEGQMLRHELAKLSEKAPDDENLRDWARAVSAAHNAVSDPLDRLDELGHAIDALPAASEFENQALVLLCELAVTSEQATLILERAERIRTAAERASSATDHISSGIRLRLCLADVTNEWGDLLSDVRKRVLNPWDTALVLGRHGRQLAWHNKPDLARDAFTQAIERGVLLNAYDDAGEWIHASRYLDIRYGPISEQVNEAYRRIQALNTAGSEQRLLRHLTSPRESVLRHLHEDKYPAAADAGRRYLRECVIAGHWGSELEAHIFLGDLFAETAEPERATRHYVRAGAQKKLETLLREGPYVDVRGELSRLGPWERAAVYRAIVAEADRVPDDHVNEIVRAALTDARTVTAGQVQQSGSAPELWASAIAAMGALVERASDDLTEETLQLLTPLIERESGKYRFTDDDHIKALVAIARGHEGHKDEALRQIGRAFDIGGPLADSALKIAGGLMSTEDSAVPVLLDLAARGNDNACLLLASRGDTSKEVLEKAKAAFNRVIERPPPKTGTVTFGTRLPQDARLIGVLPQEQRDTAANRLMQIAENSRESDWNRAQALEAIAILGHELSTGTGTALYSRAMRLAAGDTSNSDLSPDLRQKPHPLSRFKLDFSPGPLEAYGLEAAGRLAQSESETNAVIEKALSMLSTADANTTHQLAALLSWHGGDRLLANQAVLASEPNPSLRALAAVLWVQDANRDPALGERLADDGSVLVRRTLAGEIASSGEIPPDHAIPIQLAGDDHYSIRRALQNHDH